MTLSDCIKCWNAPCTCGYEYQNWSIEQLVNQMDMLSEILERKVESKTYHEQQALRNAAKKEE